MAEADLLQYQLLEAQNSDGGWGYQNGSSWTEPTALALLALPAHRVFMNSRAAALTWLLRSQRPDGGWGPQPSIPQSTWVTSLATLALSGVAHDPPRRGISWLLTQIQPEALGVGSFFNRVFGFSADPRPAGGSPWFPGTAAWVNPTAMSVLALSDYASATDDPSLTSQVRDGQEFILSRRCHDGGWNHGGSKYRSDNASSYPEMTGVALLALRGADPQRLLFPIERAIELVRQPVSIEGLSCLQLGLLAHGRDYLSVETSLPCRTVRDKCLRLLALTGNLLTQRTRAA